VTQDESKMSVGGLLALHQVLGLSWSCQPILGLRQLVKGGAQDEVEIIESQPPFGPLFLFLGICNEKAMSTHGFTHA
jgi:hypothetical protein